MLPNADDRPAASSEQHVSFAVTSYIALKFRRPVLRVRFRVRRMLRTPMPKTAVHENGYTCSREHDVRPDAPTVQNDREILAETISPTMESRPQDDLGTSIGPVIRRHGPANRVAARPTSAHFSNARTFHLRRQRSVASPGVADSSTDVASCGPKPFARLAAPRYAPELTTSRVRLSSSTLRAKAPIISRTAYRRSPRRSPDRSAGTAARFDT